MIFDDTVCELGEGPLWHPVRHSLFWFDIINMRMFERGLDDKEATIWAFDEHVSAAGWISETELLIASETSLFRFDLTENESQFIVGLESDNPITRSNDGRADPLGGFWIGTMGKNAEACAGAIYRYYDGELRKLFDNITISNSICFSPDGGTAYYTDTPTQKIMTVALDPDGWPIGDPELFADVSPHNPDGSVVDADGKLWNAQWGSSRVACYGSDGKYISEAKFAASQISCPCFGGRDLSTIFATSAAIDVDEGDAGKVFSAKTKYSGQKEHQVKLG